jgi:hypothetical protein
MKSERNISFHPPCPVPTESKHSTSADDTLLDSSHFPTESFIDEVEFVSSLVGWRTTREVKWQRLAGLFMAETCASVIQVESIINPILKYGSDDISCQLDDLQYFLEFDVILAVLFVTVFTLDNDSRPDVIKGDPCCTIVSF